MKAISGKELCRLLEQHGWRLNRVKGSHHVYVKPGHVQTISVPVHGNKSLKTGLARFLLKQGGIDPETI